MIAPAADAGRSPSLRNLMGFSLAGNSVYALCQWGLLIALTKMGSPADVGRYSLALAVSAPVFMLSNLQLRNLLATDAGEQFAFADYLALRIIAVVLSLLVIGGMAVGGAYDREASMAICLVGLAKAVEALGDIFQGFAQGRERLDLVGRSLTAKGALAVIGMVGGLALRCRLMDGIVGVLLAWLIGLLAFDCRYAIRAAVGDGGPSAAWRILKPRWSWRVIWALAWLGLPLGLASMLSSLALNIPRLVVESRLGLESLGIYSALAYLMVSGQIVGSSVALGMSPRLASLFGHDRHAYRRLLLLALAICSLVGFVGVGIALCCGRQLLCLIYTPAYAGYQRVFLAVMIASLLNTSFWPIGIALTIARRTGTQMWIRALCVVAAWAGAAWMTPRAGILGVAIALCVAFAAQFVAGLVAIRDQFVVTREVALADPGGGQ